MQRSCRNCKASYDVTNADLAFYEVMSPVFSGKKQAIPPPTLCPLCRLQRRLVFRNQIHVYQRPSSLTGKQIFSRFPADVPFPVVENDWWYGDGWDARTYGRPVDWKRPFFDQLRELRDTVPHRTISIFQAENCDFCNNDIGTKNCYLVFNTNVAEDCMYCENCTNAKDCVDCTFCPGSELCFDCTRCERCYNLQSSEFCEDCSGSLFLSHCFSCKDCFGCVNLSHAQFRVFNEQKSETEYRTFVHDFHGESLQERSRMEERCRKLQEKSSRPHCIIHSAENATGNHILNSKNVCESFFIEDCEDVRFGFALYGSARSCMDYSYFGKNSELLYEAAQCGINDTRVAFCMDCWDANSDLLYCWMCQGCSNCFGCVGLQKKSWCILNKQYSKEEYQATVPLLIEHMRATKEWGEFFPMTFSPFPYNHTVAQRYFPMTETETAERGMRWYKRETEDVKKAVNASDLPDGLPETDNAIVVKSEESERPFRITANEIKRYRELHVPLPRRTYDERMEARIRTMGGIKLYERTCAKSGKPILTAYPPNAPYIIWDRDEYNKEFRG